MVLFLTIDEFESKDKIYINKSVYSPAIKAHSHKFLEIVYIYAGSGKHVIGGTEYSASRGSLFFLNYNVEHYFTAPSKDFSLLNCVFLPSVVDEHMNELEDARELMNHPQFEIFCKNSIDFSECLSFQNAQHDFENLLFSMHDEYVEKKAGYHSILQSYLIVLLTMIFRKASGSTGEQLYSRNMEVVKKVCKYIDDNYNTPLTLNEIADQAMLSPSYFSAVFRNIMGYSIFDYVHRIRIQEACSQLKQSDKTIESIMLGVGYNDPKYFYRIFKQYMSKTPGEYRKNAN